MNHARKMVLVPEQTLERLHQRQKVNTTPLTSRLNGLDHDIQDVLKSNDLTDEEKVRHYVHNLQNYLTYYNQRKDQPLKIKLDQSSNITDKEQEAENKETEPTPDQPQPQDEVDKIERDILRGLPKSLKSRGKLLIDKIREHPDIMKWNSSGQLLYENAPLAGSHVGDLVGDFLRARKGFDPIGWEMFAKGLAKMNAPEDLVRNERRRHALRDFKARPNRQEEVENDQDEQWITPTPPPSGRKTKTKGPIRSATRNPKKQMRQRWLNFAP